MKEKLFAGRRVFVTGGASGIGRSIVAAFRNEDAQVAFCDIQEKEGRCVSEETGSEFLHTDVSDEKSLTEVFTGLLKQWGDIDILINNVGISCFSPLIETSVNDFDRILSVNVRPVFIISRLWAIHRSVSCERYGRIINISSTRYRMSEPGNEGYAASKGAIVSLTHALAMSLADSRITVNCISPGWIETGDYSLLTPEDHLQHPSRRVGVPDDIARACLFLADEKNDFINGQNFVIDGGMTRKMIYT